LVSGADSEHGVVLMHDARHDTLSLRHLRLDRSSATTNSERNNRLFPHFAASRQAPQVKEQ
jgi:hypothetical protein